MSSSEIEGVFTPYTTVVPLMGAGNEWAPELERQRIAAYQAYEMIYWNAQQAFRWFNRDLMDNPIYVPAPRQIVDTTAHFYMKDFKVLAKTGADSPLGQALKAFLDREVFYALFHTAKHSGVVRGDWVLHIIADPKKASGKRVSIKSIDPASYFPIYSPDDPDEIIGVDIVDVWLDNASRTKVKRQRYTYSGTPESPRITSELALMEPDDWWDPEKARIITQLVEPFQLPPQITTIPVYAFQNQPWQGLPYGSSELKGFERLLASIGQSVSDEEVALALEGLGVYATDAPTPTDDSGNEVPWTISPGRVIQLPSGKKIDRVQGVGSIKPMQDHIKYVENGLYDASATFRPSIIDTRSAQSGIALAIKFLPTMAKMDQRDQFSTAILKQLFHDWVSWTNVYEKVALSGDIDIVLGEKLPEDPAARLNELNNMFDRNVISAEYYREKMSEWFGYEFPTNISQQIVEEKRQSMLLQQELAATLNPSGVEGGGPGVSDQSGVKNRAGKGAPQQQNNARNKAKPNESAGTEAK